MVTNRTMPRKSPKDIPDGVGSVRVIRHKVTLGGVEIDTVKRWSKEELAYSAGSNAAVTFKIEETDWLAVAQKVVPLPLVIRTTLMVDGQFVFTDAEEFSGIVDSLDLKPMEGVYEVHASSYARILVNEKISETIAGTANANKTTGQVIKEMTAKYGKGLKCHVDPYLMTATKVGKVYKAQMVKTIKNMPIWDLFQSFAQHDHADLFVKGDTLYYVRKPVDANPDITELGNVKPSYVFRYGHNIEHVTVKHSPLFSHDVTVTVRSYQPRTQQTYESTKNMSQMQINKIAKQLEITASREELDALNAKSLARMKSRGGREMVGAKAAPARIGSKENFTFVVPNATQEDCERIAEKIMEDIARKEFILDVKVLGQPDYNPRQYIQIEALPAKSANQVYAIKSIRTSSGVNDSGQAEGYATELMIVNHAVQTPGASFGV